MKSLAIWKKRNDFDFDQLHINVWKLPFEKKKNKYEFKRVIDFGFMLDLTFNEKEIINIKETTNINDIVDSQDESKDTTDNQDELKEIINTANKSNEATDNQDESKDTTDNQGKLKEIINTANKSSEATDNQDESKEINIKIYYPKSIKNSSIIDLVSTLYKDIESKLISTLFNENLNLHIDSNNDFARVTGNKIEFHTYQLKKTNIETIESNNGTIISLKIKIPIILNIKKLYIRFRIDDDYSDTFCTISKPANANLVSQFAKTELFNFRINEVRDISNDLLEEIDIEKLAKFNRIQFFYICSSSDEYLFSHKPYDGLRILEKNKWNIYLNEEDILKDSNNILAYQFKEKKVNPIDNKTIKISDFNFLIQTRYNLNNRKTILKYLFWLFLLTLTLNLATNFIWDNKLFIIEKVKDNFINIFYLIINIPIKMLIIFIIILIFPTFILSIKKLIAWKKFS